PEATFYWLTLTPEILPASQVEVLLKPDIGGLMTLLATEFDLALNFDKDREACAFMNLISAKAKKGFHLHNGKPSPIDQDAQHKFMTGIFDDLSKRNPKHYVAEVFEIAGVGDFLDEPYLLENTEKGKHLWQLDNSKPVIGLNTGCGGRWPSRLWPENHWEDLASSLLERNYEVLLLGGESEDAKNCRLANASGAKYFGYFTLPVFIDLVDACDAVITQVTMALHIAIGLKKKVVLMNNIFNSKEFYLYGLGKIVEPISGCDCFYSPHCRRELAGGIHCMKDITVKRIIDAITNLFNDLN
ncbi:MAG: glycosyltransferase family 9 protein, partial [Desulfobaccales bacterium]